MQTRETETGTEGFCNKCGEWWPLSTLFFLRREGKYRSPCIACIDEKRRQTNETKLCCVPGCTNPRYHWRFSRCYEHRSYFVNVIQPREAAKQ